ncbi:MAG: hypothetical protein J7K75_08595 [Desulfuromonas sp.]|nr:hypothetical protein [Desulfuromonas sp.]
MSRFLPVGKGIEEKFCCGATKAWEIARAPGFPAPREIRLGNGRVIKGYCEQDIDLYISQLPVIGEADKQVVTNG